MDALLRPIVADELELFVQADGYGFGERAQHGEWASAEIDRTIAAFVGDEIVATGRNYTLELTVPGGARIPAGGVSWITTRPTHRRRGLLTKIMMCLIAESSERGEVVSILTASEGGLYQRFGYGVAARIATFSASRAGVKFVETVPDAVLRMVEPEVAVELVPPLFDRVRRLQAGAVSRPDFWWPGEWAPEDWIDPRRRFDVVVEFDGVVEGYAMYAVDGEWKDGFTEKVVAVRDLIAATPAAEAALWQYLFNVDLTVGVRAWNRPLDDALPWLITDPRQIRTAQVRDSLWVRPLDTAAFLAARTYGAEGTLTIAVTDHFLDDRMTAGMFTLTGGGDGAECVRAPGSAVPDLVLDAAELGAISLGAYRASQLARAGRVVAADPVVLDRADAMFRTAREPYASTWF